MQVDFLGASKAITVHWIVCGRTLQETLGGTCPSLGEPNIHFSGSVQLASWAIEVRITVPLLQYFSPSICSSRVDSENLTPKHK